MKDRKDGRMERGHIGIHNHVGDHTGTKNHIGDHIGTQNHIGTLDIT